jgi:hypothetical protein
MDSTPTKINGREMRKIFLMSDGRNVEVLKCSKRNFTDFFLSPESNIFTLSSLTRVPIVKSSDLCGQDVHKA